MTASLGVSRVPWYRVPVLWLGIALFVASIAGCIGMIVVASQYPDEPTVIGGERLLKMPTQPSTA